MKKLLLALGALAVLTGSASAADLAARPVAKAPPPVPTASWTGCYISGGGGYGLFRVDHDERVNGVPTINNATAGGDGWLATVGAGCDYQFAGRWVVGAFADGTWSDIKGDGMARIFGVGDAAIGQLTTDWNWAVGGRIGYLVTPSVLTYVNAGFTQAHFKQQNFYNPFLPSPAGGVALPAQTFDGFFVGTGFEYAFDWLPGLFVRSEGRAAIYNRKDAVPFCASAGLVCFAAGAPAVPGDVDSRRPILYTAKAELVYRFNWGGGPVVGKY
jgi:outer membrane immunogenic protein